MAALLGIRMAYSQAYHHQANGRAEVAGRHVIDRLRLCNQETGEKWVELLPHVLDVIHDTVGESGYTPYQIVFGRERPMSGFPYQPAKKSEDAEFFLKRMGTLRKAVADTLNKHHEKWAHYSKEPERVFKPGDLVWYYLTSRLGDKLDARWWGPGKVVRRESNRGYVINIKDGTDFTAPLVLLKPYVQDQYGGLRLNMFFNAQACGDGK